MVKQYEDLKTVSLCFMKKVASGPHISPIKLCSDFSISAPVEEEWEEEENDDEDMCNESDNSISEGSDCGSIDEDQAEQERKELRKQLADMKKKNADPTEHCEGDTDVEDLYDNPVPSIDSGMTAADAPRVCDKAVPVSELDKSLLEKGKDKLVGDKGKGVVDDNKGSSSKKSKKDNGGLSPPPSDGDDADMLCSEDDDQAVKDVHMKPGKKRRPRKRQVRIWFNASNILDPSQFCKGLCFLDMDQLRLAVQS